MSYEVTATRKRPRSFDDLTGQEFVVATLKNAIDQQQIAHAYLFAGPRGVGKTSAARLLAIALNCPDGPTTEPCIGHELSEEIARGTSMDVIEIDGASNTSVNDVRQIKDEVLFAPNTARYKIYIIDEVHMLSNSAFNALLKTIEEPPPYIVFVFATTEVHKVPATIRSRCQQFNFRLIPQESITASLQGVCEENSIDAEEEALLWIAKEARGSLRDAYTLFDQVAAFCGTEITFDKIRDTLGVGGIDRLNAIAEALVQGDAASALEQSGAVLDAGVSVEQFVAELAEYFRNLLFISHGVQKASVLGYDPSRFSDRVREGFGETQLERALELLVQLYRDLRYSLNQRFELELVISRLATVKDFLTSQEILGRIEGLRSDVLHGKLEGAVRNHGGRSDGYGNGSAESPDRQTRPEAEQRPQTREPAADQRPKPDHEQDVAHEPEAEAAPSPNPAAPTQLGEELVKAIVDKLKKRKLTLASNVGKASKWLLTEDSVELEFEAEYAANAVRQELPAVRETMQEVLDEAVELRVHVRPSNEGGETQRDEQVETIRQVFRGEVIDE